MDELIKKCIEMIWDEFDKDGNGYLDKDETKAFIIKSLAETQPDEPQIDDATFEECFNIYDHDGTGKITKNEMTAFIKKISAGSM